MLPVGKVADSVTLSAEQAQTLVYDALTANRTGHENALATAAALVQAEIDGQQGHGLVRVSSYAAQSLSGKVDGFVRPVLEQVTPACLRIDGKCGFAYPAINLAIQELPGLTRRMGVASAAIYHSHHFGQAGAHVERLAQHGLVAMLFGNTPKAIALWGSTKPKLGTNPIAFAAPVPGQDPLVIDLSLSVSARGKIVAAQQAGETIPQGWALGPDGVPTTDPSQALDGCLLPNLAIEPKRCRSPKNPNRFAPIVGSPPVPRVSERYPVGFLCGVVGRSPGARSLLVHNPIELFQYTGIDMYSAGRWVLLYVEYGKVFGTKGAVSGVLCSAGSSSMSVWIYPFRG